MNKKIQLALVLCLVLLPSLSSAQFSSSTNYQIQAGTVDSLGDYSSSSNFQLIGNIPYIESANTNSSNFQLISGFPFASSVSAVVVSTPVAEDDGGVTSGSILETPTSTTPEELIAIIKQINESLRNLIIQRASRPSVIFDPSGDDPSSGEPSEIRDLPDFIGDIFDEPTGRRIVKLDWKNPEVTEIYKNLILTRFLPIFLVAIIVILIFFRKRRE